MMNPTLQSQSRMAEICGVDAHTFGVWLGVDNLSANPGHYSQGSNAHGVHTLMKGLALRLEHLAKHLPTGVVILMEGDATPVEALPRLLPDLVELLRHEDFVWLGFFTSERPNRTNKQANEQGISHRTGPLFSSDARWPNVYPLYGCQMIYLSKQVIPELCKRMRESPFPHGLDRWIFSSQWVPDEKWAFTSRSLAGQWHGDSDSWGPGGNHNVGFVEEPHPDERIYIRRMSDEGLKGRRRQVWQKHRRADATARQQSAFGSRELLASWVHTPASMPPPRPPLDPEGLARLGGTSTQENFAVRDADEAGAPGSSDSEEFDAWAFCPSS